MTARCWCKVPTILHPIFWCLNFIRWSAGFKFPRSRTFTPHRGRLFTYMKHLRKLSCQRRWNSFWRSGQYFDLDLSESHRVKLYIYTLLDPRFKKFNMWPTRKYDENSQLYVHRVYIVVCETIWHKDWHVLCCEVKSTTSIATCSSYEMCGHRISKLLWMKNKTVEWQGTGKS